MRRPIISCLAVLLVAPAAHAEDSVSVVGSYYKERSTRVVQPEVTVRKDLPLESQVEATYLVDQITSASGAFTPEADKAFQEYRNEVRFGLGTRLGDFLPRLGFRYSTESDYTSFALTGELAVELFDKDTRISAQVTHQRDAVEARGQAGFADNLYTTLISLNLAQVVLPELLLSLCLETQILDGYTENPYRVEMHPRERNRYSVGARAAYRLEALATTFRGGYRFYVDSWELKAHTFDLEIDHQLLPSLAVIPKVRLHDQGGVYFTDLFDGFRTTDPKLFPFLSGTVGVQLVWRLWFLDGTFLEGASVMPYYGYFVQGTRYGNAHLAQLGGYWPF